MFYLLTDYTTFEDLLFGEFKADQCQEDRLTVKSLLKTTCYGKLLVPEDHCSWISYIFQLANI